MYDITEKEAQMILGFCNVYLFALADVKKINTEEEFNEMANENIDNLLKIMHDYKCTFFPDEEMNVEDFSRYATKVLNKAFGEEKVAEILYILNN